MREEPGKPRRGERSRRIIPTAPERREKHSTMKRALAPASAPLPSSWSDPASAILVAHRASSEPRSGERMQPTGVSRGSATRHVNKPRRGERIHTKQQTPPSPDRRSNCPAVEKRGHLEWISDEESVGRRAAFFVRRQAYNCR